MNKTKNVFEVVFVILLFVILLKENILTINPSALIKGLWKLSYWLFNSIGAVYIFLAIDKRKKKDETTKK